MKRIIKLIILVTIIGLVIYFLFIRKEEYKFISPLPESEYIQPTQTPKINLQPSYTGKVSYYTNDYCVKYNPACKTASGEIFDDSKFTIACGKEIRLGTYVKITYKDKSVVAKCNDRGSFTKKYGRVADLSKATFKELASLDKGVINVVIESIN